MSLFKTQQGVSMIEVLVAVAILSIGLLGTASLQIQSKRANLGAIERTHASILVNDMFERMRANPAALNVYLAQLASSQEVGKVGGSEPSPDCKTNACTPAELAQHDVWEWEQWLIGASEQADGNDTGGLVLPLACMIGPAGGGAGVYVVAINWRGHSEFTDGASADPCNVSGLGSGRYDGDAGADTLRRVIVVSSYVNDN